MEENKMTQEEARRTLLSYFAAFIITAIIFGGIFWWVQNDDKKNEENIKINQITQALNDKGYKYTDKRSFTKEDFKAEEVVKSEYKPIYKVTINNGEILYVGFLYPDGKLYHMDSYSIGYTLEQVQNSLNQ